jgi:hypothetical protein
MGAGLRKAKQSQVEASIDTTPIRRSYIVGEDIGA